MRRCGVRLLALWAAAALGCSLLFAQQPPKKKPVLIRPDTAETKSPAEALPPDPRQADHHLQVGDFYFKRSNYKAAEARYREAVRCNPRRVESYEKLIRTLEKQKSYSEAAQICDQFVATNPASPEVSRFGEWGQKLRAKISS